MAGKLANSNKFQYILTSGARSETVIRDLPCPARACLSFSSGKLAHTRIERSQNIELRRHTHTQTGHHVHENKPPA